MGEKMGEVEGKHRDEGGKKVRKRVNLREKME